MNLFEHLHLEPYPVFLAPMEDVTDIGFRLLCKRFGASMVYTEFVNADAVIRSVKSTLNKIKINEEERPVGIQIYGKSVESMVEAAKVVEEVHPDVIDINFGCPVKKVASKGAGAGLLQNIPLLLDITREVVKAVNIPVTVKTRLGWDDQHKIIVELAEQLQDCGIQALTIHGRTRSQMYRDSADWTLIGEVKKNPRIKIPIIGNGDVTTPQQVKEHFLRYGVDAVMIGRATFGQPWIFQEIRTALSQDSFRSESGSQSPKSVSAQNPPSTGGGKGEPSIVAKGEASNLPKTFSAQNPPSTGGGKGEASIVGKGEASNVGNGEASDKIAILKELLKINIERIDEYRGILHTRRHLAATPLFKGLPNFRETRIRMLQANTEQSLLAILDEIKEKFFD